VVQGFIKFYLKPSWYKTRLSFHHCVFCWMCSFLRSGSCATIRSAVAAKPVTN